MSANDSCQLVAADVGNSAIKLGKFFVPNDADVTRLPSAQWVQKVCSDSNQAVDAEQLESVARSLPASAICWYVVSVNGRVESQLSTWIHGHRPHDRYAVLQHHQFPVSIDLPEPHRVGTDRLAAAVAANALRSPQRGVIIVDAGTAVTVDVVSEDGAFRGGAILPGIQTAAIALTDRTDALPLVETADLSTTPDPIGKSTFEAIRSGTVWGCVGAVKELIAQMSTRFVVPPDIICTGGGGSQLARLIGCDLVVETDLVLRGVALTGRSVKLP